MLKNGNRMRQWLLWRWRRRHLTEWHIAGLNSGKVTLRVVAVIPKLRRRGGTMRRGNRRRHGFHIRRFRKFDAGDDQRVGVNRALIKIPLPGGKPPPAATATETAVIPMAATPANQVVVLKVAHVMVAKHITLALMPVSTPMFFMARPRPRAAHRQDGQQRGKRFTEGWRENLNHDVCLPSGGRRSKRGISMLTRWRSPC